MNYWLDRRKLDDLDADVKVQLAAVERSPERIRDIKEPSEILQLAAVKRRPEMIQYIKTPTYSVQIAAIERNSKTIHLIKNPTKDAIKLAREKGTIR